MQTSRFLATLGAIMLALPLTVSASSFLAGDTVSLPADEVRAGNLYAAGGTVAITSAVDGDAMLAGGSITVTGNTADDLTVAGGNLTLVGDIGDDLRAAGGTVTLSGNVVGEAVITGGVIHVLPDAVIDGDVTLAGGEVVFEGTTKGRLEIVSEKVTVAGTVAGDVHVKADRLTVTSRASVVGALAYESPNEATISEEATLGSVDYTKNEWTGMKKIDSRHKQGIVTFVLALLGGLVALKIATLLILALVATTRFQRTTDHLLADVRSSFGMRLLLGVAVAIVTPAVLAMLMATFVGIGFAVLLGLGFAILCGMSGFLAPVGFGNWLLSLSTKGRGRAHDWKAALLGYAVMGVLIVFLLPVGMLVALAWYFPTLGALSRALWKKVSSLS